MKKCLAVVILLTIIVSCKKSSSESINQSLIGKWNFKTTIAWITQTSSSTIIAKDTIRAMDGLYSDFRIDGKVYSRYATNFIPYYDDTSDYEIHDDLVYYKKNGVNTDTLKIILTNNNLSLYKQYPFYNNTEIIDRWLNYTKE